MAKSKARIVRHPQRTPDGIRELILRELFELHKNSRGLTSSRLSISELKRLLKGKYGLSDREIVSNLDYLIQSNWVRVETETSEFTTPRGFRRTQEKKYFKISDIGINYFEGISKFQKVYRSFDGINITNVNGVTILGDGNTVVNTQFISLLKQLSLLSEIIKKSSELDDEEKLNYVGEVETIKAQLMKTKPDRAIIRRVWKKLKPLATIAGIASFFQKVAELISALL